MSKPDFDTHAQASAKLALALNRFLENLSVSEEHSGESKRREWADRAQTWLYPGDCWGEFKVGQLQEVRDALSEFTRSLPSFTAKP